MGSCPDTDIDPKKFMQMTRLIWPLLTLINKKLTNPIFLAFMSPEEDSMQFNQLYRYKWGMFGPLYLLNKHGDLSFLKFMYYFKQTFARNI